MSSDLVKRFYRLQEERIQTYRLFEEGHCAYLQGAPQYNFPMYRQLVHEITQTFKNISDEVIDMQKKFSTEHDLPDIARLLDKVQEAEKDKLEITVKLQLAKQNVVDHPNANYQVEVDDLKQQMRQVMVSITELLEEFKYETEEL